MGADEGSCVTGFPSGGLVVTRESLERLRRRGRAPGGWRTPTGFREASPHAPPLFPGGRGRDSQRASSRSCHCLFQGQVSQEHLLRSCKDKTGFLGFFSAFPDGKGGMKGKEQAASVVL